MVAIRSNSHHHRHHHRRLVGRLLQTMSIDSPFSLTFLYRFHLISPLRPDMETNKCYHWSDKHHHRMDILDHRRPHQTYAVKIPKLLFV